MIAAIYALPLALMLAGCASTVPVTLRHPDGRVVKCGPIRGRPWPSQGWAGHRGCIEDYQRQGFERVP